MAKQLKRGKVRTEYESYCDGIEAQLFKFSQQTMPTEWYDERQTAAFVLGRWDVKRRINQMRTKFELTAELDRLLA